LFFFTPSRLFNVDVKKVSYQCNVVHIIKAATYTSFDADVKQFYIDGVY